MLSTNIPDLDKIIEKYDKTFKDNRGFEICIFSNKICFATKTQAKKHRKDFELKYHKFFRVYQCDDCHMWHLSTADTKYLKNK
jgi:hypothetical protein